MLTATDVSDRIPAWLSPQSSLLSQTATPDAKQSKRLPQVGLEPVQISAVLWPAAAEQVALGLPGMLSAYWATRSCAKGVWT